MERILVNLNVNLIHSSDGTIWKLIMYGIHDQEK